MMAGLAGTGGCPAVKVQSASKDGCLRESLRITEEKQLDQTK